MQSNNAQPAQVLNYIDDSEILNLSDFKKPNGDLFHVCGRIYDNSKIKIATILFFIFIILNTDIYAENILCKFFKGSYCTEYDTITEKGIVISGLIMSVIYIILDILYEKKML